MQQCQHFQHDSAPCHTAKKVKKFLQDHQIDLIKWPGNSPDLNPIENCWSYMKRKLQGANTSSISTLKEAIKKMWVLSASMPNRIKSVLQAKGGPTKY